MPMSQREKALELCCENYEKAILEVRKEKLDVEKQLKASEKRLAKLIKLVEHNTKNSQAILNQLGD